MKLGFIGAGALTSAIVAGLRSVDHGATPVMLSPRNGEVAAGLAARFAGVRVAADNQSVLDGSDTVMLAVRPQVAHEVLAKLRFSPDHQVVSLIATLSCEEIAALTSPAGRVTRALPMPMIAQRLGATIIHPPAPDIAAFFGRLGRAIEVESVADFDALAVVTATYAAHFRYLQTIDAWLRRHGIAERTARDYVSSLFSALSQAHELAPETGFMELAREYATRGGINEQVLRDLEEADLFGFLSASLDGVHRRISGR